MGVSKSIGLFLLYYVFNSVGVALAKNSVLDPMLAASLPHLAMAAVAAWLFVRLR